jgi:hypothetical protein
LTSMVQQHQAANSPKLAGEPRSLPRAKLAGTCAHRTSAQSPLTLHWPRQSDLAHAVLSPPRARRSAFGGLLTAELWITRTAPASLEIRSPCSPVPDDQTSAPDTEPDDTQPLQTFCSPSCLTVALLLPRLPKPCPFVAYQQQHPVTCPPTNQRTGHSCAVYHALALGSHGLQAF